MTAPFPHEFVSGRIGLDRRAVEIYGHYGWMARLSEEIGADPEINLKKVAQLWIHCRLFAKLINDWGGKAANAIQQRFRASDVTWATKADMAADLTALRNQALLLRAWIRDNMPEAREASKIVFNDTDTAGNEVVNTVPKSHAITAEVAKLRALFGPVPA